MFRLIILIFCLSEIFCLVQSLTCVCTNSTHYSPVCASNGETYRNSKVVYCYNVCNGWNLKILYNRPCSDRPEIDNDNCRHCKGIIGNLAVCGSDGLSYPSIESFQCFQTCRTDLHAMNTGYCPTNCTCSTNPGALIAICGNDGFSYRNTDVLACYNKCLSKQVTVAGLTACSKQRL